MNIPLFDQTRIDPNDESVYYQAVKLSNELRPIKANSFVDSMGFTVNVLPRWGFHCETAPYSDFTRWLNDNSIKKSPSLFWFVIRTMVWRFPEKHIEIRNNLNVRHREEFDLIASLLTKQVEDLGKVGYQNLVRLDGSLTNPKSKVLKLKNDRVKIVRK